ncbi:helix-turn-helix domain-containing protein [Dyadobacter aurulentus]|uniref:helix-turn-helix domain-containing protein n=1 Tax=Dyadobacter sp. UC 10 TaxID=2605428 RepID=UPI0011F2556F|nr:helix-turn-helix transcriptional regulator [Dyadobacter sp. UC 10]KAA0992723.1 helix-turn-helix transcriptional regulator [Dyadobacter sp. UC 10]
MQKSESLEEFYRFHFQEVPSTLKVDIGQANVFRLEDWMAPNCGEKPYSRRDFYKITLIRGHNVYHYADKSIEIKGPTLVFFNPQVPYTWEPLSDETNGFFCIFREAFFQGRFDNGLSDLPVFKPGAKPSYPLNPQQDKEVTGIFEKMLNEINSDYSLKYDLVRNYVFELIHYALKMSPTETLHNQTNARSRLTGIFIELLERQFPIETPSRRFSLRSASDFASQLSVHVNHLNRCVRDTTGKTTTDHIADRLASEAKALLMHSDWNIAEIGYSLGFDEPAHFTYFFKKRTGMAPSAFRIV